MVGLKAEVEGPVARLINRLSARHVDLAQTPGRYGDGAGLYLIVGANERKQWVFRYRFRGTRRDMGLGVPQWLAS